VSRSPSQRLADICEAAERVNRAAEALERAEADGSEDEAQLAFDALLYRLVVIGEAVKALPKELLTQHARVPWREIARLRDLLAHHYYRVDSQVIRRTIETPLSELKDVVTQILAGEAR
jgi:uncharacterized protein with HEPN domain